MPGYTPPASSEPPPVPSAPPGIDLGKAPDAPLPGAEQGPRPDLGAYSSATGSDNPTPWQIPDPTVQSSPVPPGGYPAGSPAYPPGDYSPPAYSPPGPPPVYQPGAPGYQPGGPPAAKRGNGCLKAFLIALLVTVLLAIAGVVLLFVLGRNLFQSTFGTANPDDYELDASDMSCGFEDGRMEVSGVITNTTDHLQGFRISIDFVEGPGGTKLGDATAFTGSLPAGGSTEFEGSSRPIRQPSALTCQVVDVSYFGS